MRSSLRPSQGALAALMLVTAVLPMAAMAAPQAQALPSSLPAPGWAVGFHWTYRYVGPYYEQIGSGTVTYEASYINDTYTSVVVGETTTPSGPAWLVRNDHAGSMSGNATAPIVGRVPATAVFTSVTNATVLKADYGLLNFTQDLAMTATVPVFGTVSGSGHNETVATPPFVQVVFGSPADGTPWRIQTNLSSTGWYQIGSSGQQPTAGYQDLDYNLSVVGVTNVTVPAGPFEVYNISGGGTVVTDGVPRSFNQSFLWSPLVQNKVVDEGGYLLLDYFVNRPPELVGQLPLLNITSGQGADVDLTGAFSDPEGDAFNVTCQAPPGLACSVSPGRILNVTTDPGLNATFNLTVTADDGKPGGRASFTVTVLVHGPGSTNLPPVALPHGVLFTDEDTPFVFVLADYFEDPDDGISDFQFTSTSGLTMTPGPGPALDITPPGDAAGDFAFSLTVYDYGGLSARSDFTLRVAPVNDAPTLAPVGPLSKTAHVGQNVTLSVVGQDVDGDPLAYAWSLDGDPFLSGSTVTFAAALAGPGPHSLTVVADDGQGANATLTYALLVFVGPQVVAQEPASATLTVGTGSVVSFAVSADDPDSTVLDFRWSVDGTEVYAGAGRDAMDRLFAEAGLFTVRVVVADNGSNDSAEWQVNVVEVPAGLVRIESPAEGPAIRVAQGEGLALRAAVDANLTGVTYEWSVQGQVVSREATYAYPVSSSGLYHVVLRANGTYLGSVAYFGTDEVNATVVVTVPPNPGNGNNSNNSGNNGTNGTGGNGGSNQPTSTPDGGILALSLLLLAVAAAVTYLWWRRGRAPSPPADEPAPTEEPAPAEEPARADGLPKPPGAP